MVSILSLFSLPLSSFLEQFPEISKDNNYNLYQRQSPVLQFFFSGKVQVFVYFLKIFFYFHFAVQSNGKNLGSKFFIISIIIIYFFNITSGFLKSFTRTLLKI